MIRDVHNISDLKMAAICDDFIRTALIIEEHSDKATLDNLKLEIDKNARRLSDIFQGKPNGEVILSLFTYLAWLHEDLSKRLPEAMNMKGKT